MPCKDTNARDIPKRVRRLTGSIIINAVLQEVGLDRDRAVGSHDSIVSIGVPITPKATPKLSGTVLFRIAVKPILVRDILANPDTILGVALCAFRRGPVQLGTKLALSHQKARTQVKQDPTDCKPFAHQANGFDIKREQILWQG